MAALKRTERKLYPCIRMPALMTGLFIFSLASPAHAESARAPVGITTTLSASSTLHAPESADRASESSLALVPSYAIAESYDLSAQIIFSRQLENEMKSSVSDAVVGISRSNLPVNQFLRLSPRLAATIAVNEYSRERDSLRFALHFKPTFKFDLSRLGRVDWGGMNRVIFNHQFSVTRNFHSFKTSRTGSSNIAYSTSYAGTLGYRFPQRVTLAGSFTRAIGWSYEGHPKHNFELAQELSYSLSEHVELALGHSNAGAAFKENGRDSNIAFHDVSDSTVFGSVTLSY
ncbi:MAG: hypothetical protein A2428_14405 [Bdellovibrionales bacterium RIFOXYC1_FULL_54_43]|nr:MAG: hypothetical protein A2428_14405 [Bdellovibrionales bacterium RIFOXYC1_FULL_54_43]OFZ85025.1 MAG: hypothetical protein A2603_04110 [Bdellovibrionales bacterium RIFOXYD1_FULL_55_31]